MALNVTQGARTTLDFGTTIVRDVDRSVFLREADTAPLTAFLKKLNRRRRVTNAKFEWIEKLIGTPTTNYTGVAETAPGTSITVTTGDGGMFSPGDVIYVPRTGEQMLVTAVSGDTLTVTRGWGEVPAANLNTGDLLVYLAPANEENTGSPDGKYLNPVEKYNYTQIIKHAVEISRREAQTDRYDLKNPKMQELRRDAMLLHLEAIERMFLFGQAKRDTSTGRLRDATRGIKSFIQTNVYSMGGTFTRAKLVDFLGGVFHYGGKNKVMFVGSNLLEAMDADVFTTASVQVQNKSTEFGIDVTRWISPYGTIDIVYHRVLSQVHPDMGIVVDLDRVKYCYMQDTQTRLNVQPNDLDGFKDEIISDVGLQVMNEERHGIVTIS